MLGARGGSKSFRTVLLRMFVIIWGRVQKIYVIMRPKILRLLFVIAHIFIKFREQFITTK